jgi:hypothetical protein
MTCHQRPAKVLDGDVVIVKQNCAIQYVAHLTGALAPSNVPANTHRALISPWIPFRVLYPSKSPIMFLIAAKSMQKRIQGDLSVL